MKKIVNTKVVRVSRPGENPARESELRIKKAMEALSGSERGQRVLDDLALIFNGPARGLDSSGMSNLVLLVREFAIAGRRDFLPIQSEKVLTKPETKEFAAGKKEAKADISHGWITAKEVANDPEGTAKHLQVTVGASSDFIAGYIAGAKEAL